MYTVWVREALEWLWGRNVQKALFSGAAWKMDERGVDPAWPDKSKCKNFDFQKIQKRLQI